MPVLPEFMTNDCRFPIVFVQRQRRHKKEMMQLFLLLIMMPCGVSPENSFDWRSKIKKDYPKPWIKYIKQTILTANYSMEIVSRRRHFNKAVKTLKDLVFVRGIHRRYQCALRRRGLPYGRDGCPNLRSANVGAIFALCTVIMLCLSIIHHII